MTSGFEYDCTSSKGFVDAIKRNEKDEKRKQYCSNCNAITMWEINKFDEKLWCLVCKK